MYLLLGVDCASLRFFDAEGVEFAEWFESTDTYRIWSVALAVLIVLTLPNW